MDTENSGIPATMLVGPTGYGSNFGGGWGNMLGGDGSWLLLLVILLCGGGGWGFGGGWGGMGGFGGMYEFPWLLNGQNMINANTNAGFDHAATQTALGDLSTAVTAGFGNVQNSLCSGFAGVAQQMTSNQLADLERSFAAQTASMQGMNAIQSQLATCCCEQRASTADLKYSLATEACATRSANTANTQAILDKLCQLELDGYKRENDQLRTQLNMANLAASQTAQTAELRQSNATQLNQLVSELRSCPIPAQPVYGSQPIFTCGGTTGCGCGAV